MIKRDEPRHEDPPGGDRIPVLNVRARPQEAGDAPRAQTVSEADIEELAERVLDRIAPILHDALLECIDEFLAEREPDRPADRD